MTFTCDYCGITVPATEWAEHCETNHHGEQAEPDTRYSVRDADERAYWRREFAAEQSEVLGR